MKRCILRARKGQSVLEYAILLGVVVAVVIAAQLYFKRGLQGRWKDASDQIGEQFTTAATYTSQTRQQSVRREETGTAAQIGAGNWTESKVQSAVPAGMTIPAVGGKETAYTGHETTRTDFVNQAIGAGTLGTHGKFDSGQISKVKLYDDD